MWKRMSGWCTLVLAVFAFPAWGQTLEELKKENQALKARIQALEAGGGVKGVVISYDAPSGKLLVKVGDKDRTLVLMPRTHVHDVGGYEVRAAERPAKLLPGVPVEIVEEKGQLIEINILANGARPEWRFVDPFYPGWHRPEDDYRPGSWMPPPSEGFLQDLLFGRFVDTHRAPNGTPWIHPFTIEPAQIHRDAFFFYKYSRRAEGGPANEHEAEFHLDGGLTRRFGILLAAPLLGVVGPDGEASGFGDLEVGPRVVLIESDSFYLATNIFMTIPIGDKARDLGQGEMTIAPFLTTWHDVGSWAVPWRNWNVLQLNFGPQVGMRSGDTSLLYTVVYSHSILGPRLLLPHHHGNGHSHQHDHSHQHGHAHQNQKDTGGTISVIGPAYPIGLTSFIMEFNGQSECQGDRFTFLQLLTGFSYVLTESSEIRFGVNFPLNRSDQQTEFQYIFAFTQIF